MSDSQRCPSPLCQFQRGRYCNILSKKVLSSFNLLYRINAQSIFMKKPKLKKKIFPLKKYGYLNHLWPHKGLRGTVVNIENRIYIRVEFKESLGMNLSVPFSLKGSSKCTNHVNVHKLYAVEYMNTVCSLDFPFQLRIF